MEARRPDGSGSNTPIGLTSPAAGNLATTGASIGSLASHTAEFVADTASPTGGSAASSAACSGASHGASSAAHSNSSGTRRSLRDSDAAGEVDEAPAKRAKCAASAGQQHRAASLGSLATVELQLVMQCLDVASLINLANCSKTMQRAADHPFAWVFVPTVRVCVATDAHAARLAAGVSRHAPLNIVHVALPRAGLKRFDLAPLVAHRVTKLKYILTLTNDEIDAIRQMRWLIELNTWKYWNSFDRPRFDRLLAPGHRLDKLEHLDLVHISIDDAAIRLLAGLPSLNSLGPVHPVRFYLSDWSLLTLLQQLTRITLEPNSAAGDAHAYYTALASMPRLLRCIIRSRCDRVYPVIPAPLVVMPMSIPTIPQLQSLTLTRHRIESFAFLRNLPQLERFFLDGCVVADADDEFATLLANWPAKLKAFLNMSGTMPNNAQCKLITTRMGCELRSGDTYRIWPPDAWNL